MLGTLAACLRFRRPRGRGRRSPLLNVGARLAAGSPVDTVEAACAFAKATAHRDAARFGPPVFSFLLGGARIRKELRIDGPTSPKDMPPAAAAASQEKNASRAVWTTAPLAMCAALLRLDAGAFRGLAAVASFHGPKRATVAHFTTRIALCGLAAFRAAGSCACIRLRGLPGSTSSPPRPLRSFRRKPRHPKISCVESQAADSNRPGCRRYAPHRGHFRRGLFNPGPLFGGVPHAARAYRCGCAPSKPPGLVLAGVATLRGQVSGVHSARIRHATARTPCHAGCFALRSPMRNAVTFHRKPGRKLGLSAEKCSRLEARTVIPFTPLPSPRSGTVAVMMENLPEN